MGIQINGQTDIISATDGSLIVSGAELSGTTNVNVSGIITASQIRSGSSFIQNNAVGLGTVSTTVRNAGVGTAIGTIVYNETTGQVEVYKRANGWVSVANTSGDTSSISATGGTVNDYSDPSTGFTYRSHTFTSPGSLVVLSSGSGSFNTIEYLLVGGGGGTAVSPQGLNREAGSGAGGFLLGSTSASVTSYPISIGNGGAGGGPVPNNGGNTTGFSQTAVGGGGGGHSDPAPTASGSPGGSGGGAWYENGTGGAGYNYPGPTQQGYPGGVAGGTNNWTGGGGGGAGSAGGVHPTNPVVGSGGAGSPNVYRYGPLSPVTYAAGGQANAYPATNNTANGAANTGNGGSGRGNGGSGIAIVRYRLT